MNYSNFYCKSSSHFDNIVPGVKIPIYAFPLTDTRNTSSIIHPSSRRPIMFCIQQVLRIQIVYVNSRQSFYPSHRPFNANKTIESINVAHCCLPKSFCTLVLCCSSFQTSKIYCYTLVLSQGLIRLGESSQNIGFMPLYMYIAIYKPLFSPL